MLQYEQSTDIHGLMSPLLAILDTTEKMQLLQAVRYSVLQINTVLMRPLYMCIDH